MYNTEQITVKELVDRMRAMQVGDEIGLSATEQGEYCYGIRCLPGGMFDNGMCWLADYYGGGATTAFSETESDFMETPVILYDDVVEWLDASDLLGAQAEDGDWLVYVEIKDGSMPETKWEFKEVKVDPKQPNRLACVNFGCGLEGRAYVSVPYNATDAEIVEIARESLSNINTKDLIEHHLNPKGMVFDTDFTYINVDHYYHEHYDDETTDPVGTVV